MSLPRASARGPAHGAQRLTTLLLTPLTLLTLLTLAVLGVRAPARGQTPDVPPTLGPQDVLRPVPTRTELAGSDTPDIVRFLNARRATAPSLAPAGDWIAYGTDRGGDEREGFYLVTPDGTRERELLALPDAFRDFGGSSPDGSKIAYATAARTARDFDIHVLDVASGEVESNIVFSYGHATISRHLRDIVVTEYGIADLQGRTDEEEVAAMLAIADSRFQEELLAEAKEAGKIAAGGSWNAPLSMASRWPPWSSIFTRRLGGPTAV